MRPATFSNTKPLTFALARGWFQVLRLCVLGIALVPLVINPLAYDDSFFSPKWAWLASIALVGLAAILGRALLGWPVKVPLRATVVPVIVFLLAHALSIVWAYSRSLALEKTLNVAWLTAGFFIILQVVTTRKALLQYAWLWIAVATITALWTLEQDALRAWWPERLHMVSNLPDWRGYLAAGLGNTNHIGDLLALALLPTLVLLGEARRPSALNFALFAAVVLAAGLTVCYSVGSNLGLVLGALLMLGLTVWREGFRFFRRWKRWLVLALLWGGMLAFFTTDHPLNPHAPGILKQGFGSERWHEGWDTRLVIWANGLEIVRGQPWAGAGAGNFTYVFPEMRSALLEGHPNLLRYQGSWTNAAHNVLLQAWAETGVLGLFTLLAMLSLAYHSLLAGIRWCARSEFLIRMTLAGVLTAWLGHGMMNFSLDQPTGAVAFYFILAGVVVEAMTRKSTPDMPQLVLDRGWYRLRVDWRDMKQPLSAGVTLHLPRWVGVPLALALFAGALAAIPWFVRPLTAQAEYRRARELARIGAPPKEQEAHLLRALALDSWATGCRSYYSEWLVQQKRPEEALKQLKVGRKRLNSAELRHREARAEELKELMANIIKD